MGGSWGSHHVTTSSSVLLWAALLYLAPVVRSHGPPRALLTLEPPWFNVLRGDRVTLKCEGFQSPGQDSFEWFHNGSVSSIHQDSLIIPAVNIEDGGDYQCRTEQSALSNPVKLQVSSDWLLLQVESLKVMKGDSLILRCHSWKNKTFHKITYYHNDVALKYAYESFNYVISQVNYTHSGTYYCTGIIGHISHLSATVVITVEDLSQKWNTVKGVIIAVVLLVVIAMLAAAALYFYKRLKRQDNNPDELGRTEVESSISYSLLKHAENPEEEEFRHPTYPQHQ